MLKAGLIGLGKMGISHASIVGAHPRVKIEAVCDSSSLVMSGFSKYTQVKTYSDYRKMIDREDLDFVVIATPTKYHYSMVKYGLMKNLHVFCEKPFSLNQNEGEELVHLAKQKSLVNQVGYHNHFIGTFVEMKRMLQSNVIGDLVHFTGEAYGPVVTRAKGSTWRSKSEEGGGCLFDYASHVINLIQGIIDRPTKIHGTLMKQIFSREVDDAVYVLMSLENGLSGNMSVNWSDETYRKMSTSLTVLGKKGKIICDATEIKIFLKEENSMEGLKQGWNIKDITDLAIPVNFYLRGEEYSAQIDHFIDQIQPGQTRAINTFEEALHTDRVIDMILKHEKENNNG